jgi:hypothetical protein
MINLTLSVRGIDAGVAELAFSSILENLSVLGRTPEEVFGESAP